MYIYPDFNLAPKASGKPPSPLGDNPPGGNRGDEGSEGGSNDNGSSGGNDNDASHNALLINSLQEAYWQYATLPSTVIINFPLKPNIAANLSKHY